MTKPTNDYTGLRVIAEMFEDAQKTRIRIQNQIRSGGIDSAVFAEVLANSERSEHVLGLELGHQFKRTVAGPVRAWQAEQKGIGLHLMGRLLGQIGDPYMATPMYWQGEGKGERVLVAGEPYARRVSQLWSYCGHGDPTRKRRAGMDKNDALALGSPKAKMLVHLTAEACVKAGVRGICADGGDRIKEGKDGCARCDQPYDDHTRKSISDYGQVYLDAKHHYEDRVHATDCVRCGPSGRPAQPGSPWSKAHQHAAALRKVGKTLLRDLWLAGREGLVVT